MEIFCVFIGWFLGLCSQPIASRIEKYFKRKDCGQVILSELKSLAARLTLTCYQIQLHLGVGGKENLFWMKTRCEKYQEDFLENAKEAINKLLEVPDEQFDVLIKTFKKSQDEGLHLKTFSLAFVESILESLSIFEEKFQRGVLEIRAQISILNEEIENAHYYFRLTFEPESMKSNGGIIRNNLNKSYFETQKRCKVIVEKIDALTA